MVPPRSSHRPQRTYQTLTAYGNPSGGKIWVFAAKADPACVYSLSRASRYTPYMQDIERLLALLRGVGARHRSVHAVYEHESDLALLRESAQRWSAMQAGRPFAADGAAAADSVIQRSVLEVWRKRQSDWRVETREGTASDTRILSGDRWWSIHSRFGAMSNVREDGSYDANYRTDVPRMVQMLLDPSDLPALMSLQIDGEATIAGRQAVLASGTLQEERDPLLLDFPYADALRLGVDGERGVLLRFEAELGGRCFISWQAQHIEFDVSFAREIFQPPDGFDFRPRPGK